MERQKGDLLHMTEMFAKTLPLELDCFFRRVLTSLRRFLNVQIVENERTAQRD